MVALQEVQALELFQGLAPETLDQVARRFEPVTFPAGTTIFYRGDPGASMFVILSGRAAVTLNNVEGLEYTIATLGPGEVFGEMALLTGEPRSANVRTVSEVKAVEVRQAAFGELIRIVPELNARLLRLLAERLGKTTIQQQVEHLEGREIIAGLLSHQQPPEVDHYPGQTKWARQVNEAIEALADTDEPVLILGEAGTGRRIVSKLIHYRKNGDSRPLFCLDCASPPPVLRESPGGDSDPKKELLVDAGQEPALFGHEPGGAVYAKGTRRGYLELADGGTLILANVEHLNPRVQTLLCDYLRDHAFSRKGETEVQRSDVRVIATSSEDLRAMADQGAFNAELLERLSGHVIELRPLRERKKDIPVIAGDLLAHFSRKAHKKIDGFSSDAMNTLVDHAWPLNVDELRHVVGRAVAICPGEEIRPEHLFLDISPFSAAGTANLLKLDYVSRIVHHRLFPTVLRFVTVPFFIFLILYTLLGPKTDNLANLIVWAVWWPLLILSIAVSARSWCGFCPLTSISNMLTLRKRLFSSAPAFLKKHGFWIGVAGFLVILWAEHSTQMFTRPRATSVLLIAILGGAVITSLLFGERIWCRHLCPLGKMVGQYASIAPVVLRGNSNVCLSQCRTHDCVKDSNCPMDLHPSSPRTNHDCILCLSCVKSCTHRAIHVDARLPGHGILTQKDWDFSRSFFSVLLAASVPAATLSAWITTSDASRTPALASLAGLPGISVLTFVGITAVFLGVVFLASAVAGRKDARNIFVYAGYAYLPLAFAGFFSIYFREFISHGDKLGPLTVDLIGLGGLVPRNWVTPNLGTLKAVLPVVTAAGAVISLYVLNKIATKWSIPQAARRAHQLVLVCTALVFLAIL
jgi:DNA-binding NtrC family response regulator/ferredoxin